MCAGQTARMIHVLIQEGEMRGYRHLLLRPCHRVATVGVCVAAAITGPSLVALAQEQSVASIAEIIFARKTLMAVIASNMYEIDGMVHTGKIDLARGRANADSISAMMMAFPLLFPASTNTWTPNAPRDPAVDTFADPGIWKTFAFFYKESLAASKYAYNASRAENDAEFKKYAVESCD